MDPARQASRIARQAAERLDEPVARGTSLGLPAAGCFDVASRALQAVELPLVDRDELQLSGSLALASSLVSVAQRIRPNAGRGPALARPSKRRDEAVRMIRRAELLPPAHVLRRPVTISVIGEVLTKTKDDAVGRQLRGIAYRAGLPV
ncbi:hypothetical protein GCM10027445_65380 [Amycolatopsis endophytica]|uniref:Uncharacterized protein n=1 Tax=Amycolatopsis endophytica TaxID=860233 RepID=A0A853AZA9_9PSEU|nr:hypothetical protein [Amycolatopsis endophytica]NYI87982.1 hypothetical protein [Amycolatopsis endophytica]